MFTEDDLLPLSALQHLLFCERQCALIHVEQQWSENRRTVEGKQLHDRVHEQGNESRGDLRIARGVALRSLRLGLIGVADVIEFHRVQSSPEPARIPAPSADEPGKAASVQPQILNPQSSIRTPQSAISLPGADGLWEPFPIEYKRGKPKRANCDAVQLCAQALCLEEMLNVSVPEGALFYGVTRHRFDVTFDDALRAATEAAAVRLHEIVAAAVTPAPKSGPHCRNCSLVHECLPKAAQSRSARRYLERAIREGAP